MRGHLGKPNLRAAIKPAGLGLGVLVNSWFMGSGVSYMGAVCWWGHLEICPCQNLTWGDLGECWDLGVSKQAYFCFISSVSSRGHLPSAPGLR